MARQRNPLRDKAKEIWLNSNGVKPLVEIATELNKSSSTIRKWKSLDSWDGELKRSAPLNKGSAPFKYEGMKANKNATGNKGGGAPTANKNAFGNDGGAPKGNKNAVVTGEYETISFDYLSEEERLLFEEITDDPLITINTTIRELKIRKRRILMRISNVEAGLDDFELTELQQLRSVKEKQKYGSKSAWLSSKSMIPVQTEKRSFRKLDDILKLEDVLTRIEGQLLRALNQKDKIISYELKSELMQAQINYTNSQNFKLKIENNDLIPSDDVEDDGFLEAIKNMANDKEVWDDGGENEETLP
ncbi:phage terminase small subunit [Carnobacterium maltaromaticum]|uniref:phage terminase small subunit n=1 Tax=Carnobacterium maltaromaticum TaxID=2751 RepID=UPI001D6D114E|nr:phage terminase small subunit [Carnobacterium maltaromaticum]MCC4310732.1 hypothetical protein [Carnobacterium maltaromaticum]